MHRSQSLKEAMVIIGMIAICTVMICRRVGLEALDYMEHMVTRLAVEDTDLLDMVGMDMAMLLSATLLDTARIIGIGDFYLIRVF
ncbi:MAG: hypothetical protein RL557_144 [archaeon]